MIQSAEAYVKCDKYYRVSRFTQIILFNSAYSAVIEVSSDNCRILSTS